MNEWRKTEGRKENVSHKWFLIYYRFKYFVAYVVSMEAMFSDVSHKLAVLCCADCSPQSLAGYTVLDNTFPYEVITIS